MHAQTIISGVPFFVSSIDGMEWHKGAKYFLKIGKGLLIGAKILTFTMLFGVSEKKNSSEVIFLFSSKCK